MRECSLDVALVLSGVEERFVWAGAPRTVTPELGHHHHHDADHDDDDDSDASDDPPAIATRSSSLRAALSLMPVSRCSA